MGRLLGFGTFLGLLGTLALTTPAIGDASAGNMGRGAKVYSENCGRCHNPRAPSDHLDRDWQVIVQHMRVVAHLTGQQQRDVEAFLLAANEPGPTP